MKRTLWLGWGIAIVLLGSAMPPVLAQGTAPAAPAATPATTAPAARPAPARETAADFIAQGDKMMMEKDYARALSKYVMAWLEMPDNVAVIDRIGDVYLTTQKYPQATRFYALAIKMKPDFEEPVIGLGRAYLQAKVPQQAVLLLEDPQRQRTFAKSTRFFHTLGMAYQKTGKLDKAIAALKTAVGLSPNLGYLYGDLGNSCYLAGKLPDAVDAYTKAIEKSPNDFTVLLNRSMAQEKMGKFADAAASLEQFLTLSKAAADSPQRKRLEDLKAKAAQK